MHGVLSCLPTRYPSHQDEDDGIWIEVTSTMLWDSASTRFEEEARSIGLVSTSAMDGGTSSMYRKNTGYGLFSISSKQARPIALFDVKRKSEISMILSD
eukprot:14027620-Ditylum_brightwellii.AAC.1